jgi:hypothetical protein
VKAAVAGGVNAADDCGWWLAAGRSQLVAGWPVVAFLDLLDGLSLIQQISPLNSIKGCHAKHEL